MQHRAQSAISPPSPASRFAERSALSAKFKLAAPCFLYGTELCLLPVHWLAKANSIAARSLDE